MKYIIMLTIVICLAGMDFLTGIIKAYLNHDLSSAKMRKGGLNKITELVVMATACGLEIGIDLLGRYYHTAELAGVAGTVAAGAVFTYIVIMELISIVRADELTAVMQGFIRENAEHEQDQDLYNQKYAEYEEQMNTVDAELQRMRQKKADQIARKELLEGMIREIEENDLTVTEFDEKLWRLMVESVEVDENGKLVFTLRNGMEIEV